MRIMEAAIQRATVKSTIAGFEHVGLRVGRAPLLCLRIREGVEQHVDVDTDKGVPVELVHHITSNFKNKLHFLQAEEAGWSLVSMGIYGHPPSKNRHWGGDRPYLWHVL
jgi:nucleoside diphosphate kinase